MPTKSNSLYEKLNKKPKIKLVKLAEKYKISIYKNEQSSKSQLISRLVHRVKKFKSAKKELQKKTKDKLQKICLKHKVSIYKHTPCTKNVLIKRLMHKMPKKKSRFGNSPCTYELPYFGTMVPSVGKLWSGTPNTGISSSAWMWPAPGARALDKQIGFHNKY